MKIIKEILLLSELKRMAEATFGNLVKAVFERWFKTKELVEY